MKGPAFLMAGLAVFAMAGLLSAAEPVPQREPGIWSTTTCGGDGLTLLATSRLALIVEGQGLATRVAVVRAEWVGESILLRVEGEARERVLHLDELKACDALPGSMSLLLADVVAVFGRLDGPVALCRNVDDVTAPCAAAVADLVDATGDGVFSRAELRQAARAASFFMAYLSIAAERRGAFVSLDQLLIAQLAASVLGPFVVTHLIDAYDADGDDAVSPDELLQGRSPTQAVHGILANLVAEAPPAVASVLLKSIPGFKASP